jgi:hypothetical protein
MSRIFVSYGFYFLGNFVHSHVGKPIAFSKFYRLG